MALVRRGAGVSRGARAHPGPEGEAHPTPGRPRSAPLQGNTPACPHSATYNNCFKDDKEPGSPP